VLFSALVYYFTAAQNSDQKQTLGGMAKKQRIK
jgi:hypothetical protein